ncbi:MAG: 50S ribosomal protein L13 [SAR202 cluster bacterium Casp-Chloro-G4]|nr:50S ribosomal protein L13 [Chloroflexota bacterium]MDA1228292.1 50S ribosomal protein L13 [Chloroflexota bacterium]PKB61392.1 MAG: 50S ribosomal protein L13 [SAR202 cluster bacterium Casp-Chloro-G4]
MAVGYKPYQTKASELKPEWHVVDAEGQTLGRISTEIATVLMGKHKPIYVPNLNTGDYVIVINAEKIKVTGNKLAQKMYYRHSGYHGGLTERTLGQMLAKTPTRVIRQAVKGMLPKNSLARHMLARMKVYAGPDHPHEAQIKGSPAKTSEES